MAAILTENSVAGDLLIFDNIFKKAYKGVDNVNLKFMRKLVKDGIVQIDALFERAISVTGKHKRDSTIGRDFTDGSDAKKATTVWRREAGCRTRRVACIVNLKRKEGYLRIIVAETLTNEVYYFKVPHSAYKGLKTFNIYFNEDGTPKYDGKSWQYQCRSFQEMST